MEICQKTKARTVLEALLALYNPYNKGLAYLESHEKKCSICFAILW